MNRILTGAAGVLVGGLMLIMGAAFMPAPKLASSTVYVGMNDEGGHGSGVNIGNGYVLTAAHVADHVEAPQPGVMPTTPHLFIVDSLGRHHHVEVLWANHHYDIALMRMSDAAKVASSPLSCRYLDQGEPLRFSGNPLALRDITTYGRVANPKIVPVGPWKAVNSVSGQLVPGMSGGPTFDVAGNVVGINVGLAVEPGPIRDPNGQLIGFQEMGFAISFIVPGRTICRLMDR